MNPLWVHCESDCESDCKDDCGSDCGFDCEFDCGSLPPPTTSLSPPGCPYRDTGIPLPLCQTDVQKSYASYDGAKVHASYQRERKS